jgi:protein involved in polysaccharide export with SLBB domain
MRRRLISLIVSLAFVLSAFGQSSKLARSESVFVIGEVIKPGEFGLRDGHGLSVLHAVRLSGGLTNDADKAASYVIRVAPDGSRVDIPLDLDRLIREAKDVGLMPNDIVFIPDYLKSDAKLRALSATITVLTSRLRLGRR